MILTIHQAKFGAQGPLGHSLISSSMRDKDFLRKLSAKTDLPSNPPYGTTVNQYFSSYLLDGNWILSKTYPDHEASRGDSVFTHALIMETHFWVIEKKEILQINDLAALARLIPESIDRSEVNEPIKFDNSSEIRREVDQGLVSAIIKKLLASGQENSPLICLGQSTAFFPAYCQIWNQLPLQLKLSFEFRIAFIPERAPKGQLLVLSPESLRKNWDQFTRIHKNESAVLKKGAEFFLLGDTSKAHQLKELMSELKISPVSFRQLSHIQNLFDLLNTNNPDHSLLAARELGSICPDPKIGKRIKTIVFDALLKSLVGNSLSHWMRIRNFPTHSFLSSEPKLKASFAKWVKLQFIKLSKTERIDLFAKGLDLDNPFWWRTAFREGMRKFIESAKLPSFGAVWELAKHNLKFADLIIDIFPDERQLDPLLMNSIPEELSLETAAIFLQGAYQRKWPLLHGALVGRVLDYGEAISRQLEIDANPSHLNGLEELGKWIDNSNWLSKTLSIGENRMVSIAAKRALNNPELFEKFEVTDSIWRRIWLAKIELSSSQNIWAGISNPTLVCYNFITLLLNREKVDQKLVILVSSTPEFRPLDYPDHSQLWNFIPKEVRGKVIKRTALYWLEKVKTDRIVYPLKDSVLKDGVQKLIDQGSFDLAGIDNDKLVIDLIQEIRIKQNTFLKLIRSRKQSYNKEIAQQIGKITLENKWKKVAFFFKDNRKTRKDFGIIYRICERLAPRNILEIIIDFFEGHPRNHYSTSTHQKMETRILFAAANPFGQKPIRPDLEERKVRKWIDKKGNNVSYKSLNATQFMEFINEMARFDPSIVQFSGHGNTDSLVFETEEGSSHQVNHAAIDKLFETFKDSVDCVVLNACYSKEQAKMISKHGIYVVGMSQAIYDKSAREFSEGFYIGIAGKKPFEKAFNLGITAILVDGDTQEATIPELWHNGKLIED